MLNKINLPSPLTIPKNVQTIIHEKLREKLIGTTMNGYCFFRRFNYFLSTDGKQIITKNIDYNTSIICNSFDGISPEDMDRYMEIKYRSFSGITYSDCVRPENSDELTNRKITIHSKNYSQVDFTLNYTFEFSNDKRLCSPITPVRGDLLFIFVSTENLNKVPSSLTHLSADKWCIVSDQFLHMYSAIMYDWDDTFQHMMPKKMQSAPLEEREKILKSKLFTGNRLMTNSWLKYKLALEDNGQKLSKDESQKRYWHLRTEFSARKWVDVYVAIVLIARYGELPCPNNIPDYVQGPDARIPVFHRKKWNLPVFFMTNFLRGVLDSNGKYNHIWFLNHSSINNIDKWELYYPSYDRALFGTNNNKEDIQYGLLDKLVMTCSDNLNDKAYNIVYGDAKNIISPSFDKGENDFPSIKQNQKDITKNNDISTKSAILPVNCTWAKVVARHTSVTNSNENKNVQDIMCTISSEESGGGSSSEIKKSKQKKSVSLVSINLPCPSSESLNRDPNSSNNQSDTNNSSVQIDISNTSTPNVEGTTIENTFTIQLQFDLPGNWSDILMEDEK